MNGNSLAMKVVCCVLVFCVACSGEDEASTDAEDSDVGVTMDADSDGETTTDTSEPETTSVEDVQTTDTAMQDVAEPESDTASPDTAAPEDVGGSADVAEASEDAGSPSQSLFWTCHEEIPEGVATAPDPPSYSAGDCPGLEPGFNTLELEPGLNPFEDDNDREFMLVVPEDLDEDEVLPVIFLWHWLGGSATRFYERGEIQEAVDTQRFLAVIPEEKGDLQFRWPYSREVEIMPGRVEEELEFFDDMLSCVSEQYNINNDCVSSAGVSAGALWTAQLVGHRSEYLSSFISLSGGVGAEPEGIFDPEAILPWTTPERQVPGIVLWGGSSDWCIIDFDEASTRLEYHLEQDGHFFVECIHNCGHSKPPMEGHDGLSRFAGLWEFAFEHPYGVEGGTSPYEAQGLPESVPDWCGIGADSATEREGECGEDGCQ